MEDLVPLLIFVAIAAINLFKFIAEKGGKAKPAQETPPGTPPRRPSSLEQFFENLAEQVAPPPREIPDWPEGYERPDYVGEMEALEAEQTVATYEPPAQPEPEEFQPLEKPAIVQGARRALSGSHGLRMPGNTFISTGKAGRAGFRIEGKKDLKQALIGHIIFSPPRACDLSFDNTIAKQR